MRPAAPAPRRIAAALFVGGSLAGCGSTPPPPEPPEVAAARAELAKAPAPTPAPPTARSFDPTDHDHLAEVYRRIQKGDNGVFADFGMVTPTGLPDPRKVDLYYQAIQRVSQRPEDWKRLLEKAGTAKP